MRRQLALVLVLAGCIEVPEPPGKECHVSRDCDPGETCSGGLCYGNPPAGTFAATVSAPAAQSGVIGTEIANLMLPADGYLGEIQLEAPITFSGRVEAYCASGNQTCSTLSIGAQIRLTRPSRIPGAPALRFSVESKPDLPRGSDSFTIRIPRTLPSDEPWTVTFDPDGGGEAPAADGSTDPAELVPPKRLSLFAADDIEHQTYTLGDMPNPVTITGNLRDAFQSPLTKYRVVALARWAGEPNATEVSTVDFSADGSYSITIADNVMPPLEIVARPYDENDVSPTLHLQGVDIVSGQRNLTQPTGLGQRRMVDIPVQALANTGEVRAISGVRVIVSATIQSSLSENMRAEFRVETTTGEDGIAHFAVLDGSAIASNYVVRLVPPASSIFGIVDNGTLQLPYPLPVRLPKRISLSGSVVDVDGHPLASVSVTARRSPRFLWSVSEADQQFLDEIPAATALTTENGGFVVFVDPAVAGTWANYDLFFETPASSTSPSWWLPDIEIPRVLDPGSVSVETVVLPDGARMLAKIVNADGQPVEGSDLRIFQIYSNDSVCMQVTNPPETCAPATIVRGHSEADGNGKVTLTLPRP
jgi:hypothetical protein